MFESIYTGAVTPAQFFLTAAVALVSGVIYAWVNMGAELSRRNSTASTARIATP